MKRLFNSTFTLVLLLVSAIVLASFVWITFPKRDKERVSSFDGTQNYPLLFAPEKMTINYGENSHKVVRDLNYFWKLNHSGIRNVLAQLEVGALTGITEAEYISLCNKPSIILGFQREYNSNLLANFWNNENERVDKVAIRELYLSRDGQVVIKNSYGIFKTSVENKFNVDLALDGFSSESYTNFKNLWELYGVEKNIYYPSDNILVYENIIFENALGGMDSLQKNTLASLYLKQDIDYIMEIAQQNSTTYVYDNRILKFFEDGVITYEDRREGVPQEANLFKSIESTMNFIYNNTATGDNLILFNIIKTEDGYKFIFNHREQNLPLVLGNGENYIEVETKDNVVKTYRRVYRTKVGENYPEKSKSIVSLEEIYKLNREYFRGIIAVGIEGEFFTEFLNRIDDIGICYVDTAIESTPLKVCTILRMAGTDYYFDIESGELVMERKNGLV